MEIYVRPIEKRDYEQWLPLWDGYNSFYNRTGPTALDPKVTETTWSRFFDDSEPVFALVAEQEDKLIGLTHYLFHRSTSAINPSCYLQDLFTLPQARGKGVGRALINAVYDIAQREKCPRVYWTTQETNHTAMQLYDKVATKSDFVIYRKIF